MNPPDSCCHSPSTGRDPLANVWKDARDPNPAAERNSPSGEGYRRTQRAVLLALDSEHDSVRPLERSHEPAPRPACVCKACRATFAAVPALMTDSPEKRDPSERRPPDSSSHYRASVTSSRLKR